MGLDPITSFDQLNAYLMTEFLSRGIAIHTSLTGPGEYRVRPALLADIAVFEFGERVMIEIERCSDAPEWAMVREERGLPERIIRNPQWRPPRPRDPS